MAEKKQQYPKIETNVTTSTYIHISKKDAWYIEPCTNDNSDPSDVKAGNVFLTAPCREEVVISKSTYLLLRQTLDTFFKVE